MAFSAISQVGSLDIGSVLKIVSSNGVYKNLSEESEMWKMVLKKKAGLPEGRQFRYNLMSGYGPAAVQNLPASAGDYPSAQRVTLNEGTAYYKDFGLTVAVQNTIVNKALNELSAYEKNILQMEIDAKTIAAARMKSAELYGDGSAVQGIISGTPTIASGVITCTLNTASANGDRSHVGWFNVGDRYRCFTSAGADHNDVNGGTASSYLQVTNVDEENNTVTLAAYDSSDAQITITSLSGDDVADGDYLIRLGENAQDWSAITSSVDYATSGYSLIGLGGLSQDDNRLIHGINHTGNLSGTRKDVSGAQIDMDHFQAILSKVKRKVGRNRYQYNAAFMWDEVYDSLIAQSEVDRRIQSIDDGTRGFKRLGYQHGKTFIDFVQDEFCPKSRVYMLPESKEVMEFRGTDFETVDVGGKIHLSNASSGSGHARESRMYMEGAGVLLTRHPAAIACIEGFTF